MIGFAPYGVELTITVAEALLKFASLDSTRLPMYGIGFDDQGNLAATDGHTALRYLVGAQGMTYVRSVWSRDLVEQLIRSAKAIKASHIGLLPDARVLETQFPPLSAVMPAGVREGGDPIGFNASYVARLAFVTKSYKEGRKGTEPAAQLVGTGGPLEPLLFRVERECCPTAEIAIMPMRI